MSRWRQWFIKHIEKCIANGLYVLPVKGIGNSDVEAKIPLYPKGYKPKEYKNKKVLKIALETSYKTLELAKQGKIFAYGIPGSFNMIIWLDIDTYAMPNTNIEDIVKRFVRAGCYVEKTAKGGYHIGIKARDDEQLNIAITSKKGKIDVKTFGYVIAHPSVLIIKPINMILPYKKLPESPEIYEPIAYLDEVIDLVHELGTISFSENVATDTDEREVKPRNIRRLGVFDGLDLDAETTVKVLYMVFKTIECEGYAKIMAGLAHGKWIVPYTQYGYITDKVQHSRSTWGIVEVNLGSILYILGFTEDTALRLGELIDQAQERACFVLNGERICGDPSGTPAVDGLKQGYRYPVMGLDRSPWCVAKYLDICNNLECSYNAVSRLLVYGSRYIGKLKAIRRMIENG